MDSVENVPTPKVWVQTFDGPARQVDAAIVFYCPLMHYLYTEKEGGRSEDSALGLSIEVDSRSLDLIVEHCRFHLYQTSLDDRQRREFDRNFLKRYKDCLPNLFEAASALQIRSLVALMNGHNVLYRNLKASDQTKILAQEMLAMRSGRGRHRKTVYAITFDKDPIRDSPANYRKENEDEGNTDDSSIEGNTDDRSIESLLSFIDGCGEHEKDGGTRKSSNSGKQQKATSRANKKSKKKKDGKIKHSGSAENETPSAQSTDNMLHLRSAEHKTSGPSMVAADEEVKYYDDNSDPELMRKLEIEVEEFERRLNLSWEARKQEIFGPGVQLSDSYISG